MPSFAHYDAAHPLEAGLCVSAFLVSIDHDRLLAGRIQDTESWRELEPIHTPEESMGPDTWVLPAAHLLEGEHPDDAARRVVTQQLGADHGDMLLSRVLSYAYPLQSRDQEVHWDICFVYDTEVLLRETPSWFAELRHIPLMELRHGMFARGHGDVLADLSLVDAQ